MKKYFSTLCLLVFLLNIAISQTKIIPGAERVDVYASMLKGRSVAVFANQTSMVGNTHLVDTLVKRGIKVVKIFSPEHGFRGNADAVEKVGDYTEIRKKYLMYKDFAP